MPATYTNLGIKKIATGDESGTWGTSTNTNFDYFDTAIVGYVGIAMTNAYTSGSPYALNVADFSASNGRNRLIEFTGTPGVNTYVKITPNDFVGYYFIRNSVAGSYSVFIFQTDSYDAAKDVELPSGKDLIIRCDGGGSTAAVVKSVLDNPVFTSPALGTPSSGVLTNCTGLPISTGVANLGTGVSTFLTTPSSANLASAVTDETGSGALVFGTSPTIGTPTINSPTLTTPVLGTPSSGTLTNCTGLPVSTGISGLGAGVATFLATPSSANLATAVTGETGSGALVFGTSPTIGTPTINSPTLTTPVLGTPSSGTLTNCTGLPVSTGISGLGAGVATFLATPSSANLATAVTGETGSGALVFGTSPTIGTPTINSPTLTTPVLGTPSSGTLTNCTGLPVSTGVSGLGVGVATFLSTPSSANLASAVTDETGTGALVFGTSPTLTTPTINSPTLTTPSLGVATATSINKVAITAPATSATLTIADGKTATINNSIVFSGTDSTTMTFPDENSSIGFRNIPQNSKSVDFTLALSDSGKHIYHPSTDNVSRTFTIPPESTTNFALGSAITFVNYAATSSTIAAGAGVTLRLAGGTSSGNRTLAQYGVATAIKIDTDSWIISGAGIT